jgi:hypothetical protein
MDQGGERWFVENAAEHILAKFSMETVKVSFLIYANNIYINQ